MWTVDTVHWSEKQGAMSDYTPPELVAGTNYLCSCPGPAGGTWSLVTARLRGAELGSEYSDHGLIRDWRPSVSAMFDGFKKGEYNIQRGP